MVPPLASADLQHVLGHTEPLWQELKSARLFITGGTGFVGCWLLETLLAAERQFDLGLEAVVLTRNPAEFLKRMPHLAAKQLVFHEGDVRDYRFPAGKFTHVIHAATTSSAPVDPLEMFQTIVKGTERTLDFTLQSGAGDFLFVSSGAVYGRQPEGMDRLFEEYEGNPDTADPQSAYGEGKRSAELLCAIYRRKYGLQVKIARCFAFVGPHLPLGAHFAVGNFIGDVLAGKAIHIKGGGTAIRSYLYASDLAIWLWTILLKGGSGRPYNVGSEEAISIGELAEIVQREAGGSVGISLRIQASPKTSISRYVPSVVRAKNELGLEMTVSLPQAIRQTILWHQKQKYLEAPVKEP